MSLKLTPELLLQAYCQGIFPMAQGREVYWYDPDPRTVIPLDNYHLSRSLQRTMRRGAFELTQDLYFQRVMEECAAPALGRETTWINPELIRLYTELHKLGFAHSVETWLEGRLVGGVYGVSIAGLFAGESMFSRVTDASKVALAFLLQRLECCGYTLFDVQYTTEHLKRFGALEIPREEYLRRLRIALATRPATF